MRMKTILFLFMSAASLAACKKNKSKFDASGTFEADEVVVSSSANGIIIFFNAEEGSQLAKDSLVAQVDPEPLNLQKQEVEASIHAIGQQTIDVTPQIRLLNDQLVVQQSQLDNLLHEKTRVENLVKQDAATGKQLDDINAQIDVVKKQMDVTRQQINVQQNNVNTQNRSILSQQQPLTKKKAEVQEMLDKTNVRNPIEGTVIEKYAEAGEVTTMGKALYKIANLSSLNLRAYITGTQLPQVKLGQTVRVYIDNGPKKYKEYIGTIIWIASQAEFTPKTIQTKEERANLVYAIKVKVPNDGSLKIGMYGEVRF